MKKSTTYNPPGDTIYRYEPDDSLFQIHFDYYGDFSKDSTFMITYSYLNKNGTEDTMDQDLEMIYQGRGHRAESLGVWRTFRYRDQNPTDLNSEDSTQMGNRIPEKSKMTKRFLVRK